MILFIRVAAKPQCVCAPKGTYKSRGKSTVYSLLMQKGKSLKVCSTICENCAKAFRKAGILKAMGVTEIFFLSMEENPTLPSFLERISDAESNHSTNCS